MPASQAKSDPNQDKASQQVPTSEKEQSEQIAVRREKLKNLREEGNPYPNDAEVKSTSVEVASQIEEQLSKEEGERVRYSVAGRILNLRLMGKAAFLKIQDRAGSIQIYVRRDDVGVEQYQKFKKFDLGDIVSVNGYLFKTKTEETTIHAESIRLLVKCLEPLPEKWHGLSDVEVRYRRRYLDLIVNPEARSTFVLRLKTLAAIRSFFNSKDYLEVETPFLTSASTGAAAKPFETHHNALGIDLVMRIALELPLKKLVVGGFERVYEIGRVFRNEGISTQHNPEFTMIEFYQAYATYTDSMDLTEELFAYLLKELQLSPEVEFNGHQINLSSPWRRLSLSDAIKEYTDIPQDLNLNEFDDVKKAAKALGDEDIAEIEDYGKALYEIFDRHVEDKLIAPTFITRYPLSVSPLARKSEDDERFTDRFELMVGGMELANGFSELNDPDDQRERFEQQLVAKAAGDEEAMDVDEDFLCALAIGLPPTAGQGIGIDRLVMLLSGSNSIRDVILFPAMRPQDG